jgi:DNA-directed RNA polymerase sigma subunit (sigma70/sigma32)
MRRLADEPVSLAALASKLGISRERVRQIEYRAFEKIHRAMKGSSVGQKNHDNWLAAAFNRTAESDLPTR